MLPSDVGTVFALTIRDELHEQAEKMSRTCILVADRARARFFVVEAPPEHRPRDADRLLELESLVDPEGELTGNELVPGLVGLAVRVRLV